MNGVLVVLATIAEIRDGDRALGVTVIVIPYMGFAAAMLGGLADALLAEDSHRLILLGAARTLESRRGGGSP